MTERETSSPPTLDAGIEFARQVRDPKFRQWLAKLGGRARENVVIALDDEPVAQVIARMVHNGTGSPCIIAIRLLDEPFGFGILLAEKAPSRWRRILKREPAMKVSPAAHIGMLYSATRPAGSFVPTEWAKPVHFERPPVLC